MIALPRHGDALAPAKSKRVTHMLHRMLQRVLMRWRRLVPWPPVGRVRFGSLRRLTPISRQFGLDRAERERCIDIAFIEQFLVRHRADIRGRVLEIGDNRYT